MSRLLLLLALYASLVAQPLLDDGGFRAAGGSIFGAWLPALVVAAALFVCGPVESLVWASLAGLASDALHAPPFGAGMLCYPAILFAVRQVVGERPPRTALSVGVMTGATTFCLLLAMAALRSVIGQIPLAGEALLAQTGRATLGNALVAAITLTGARSVNRLGPASARRST